MFVPLGTAMLPMLVSSPATLKSILVDGRSRNSSWATATATALLEITCRKMDYVEELDAGLCSASVGQHARRVPHLAIDGCAMFNSQSMLFFPQHIEPLGVAR
jgi:hypothetical protein